MAFRIPPEAFKDIKDTYDARFTTLAGVTILFYDSLITFASEVRYLWPKPWSHSIKSAYLFNKYLTMSNVLVTLYQLQNLRPPLSLPVCQRSTSAGTAAQLLSEILCKWILTKRLVALYAQNKIIVRSIYITYVLCYFATGLVTIVSINYNYHHLLVSSYSGICVVESAPTYFALIFVAPLIYELYMAILTIRKAFMHATILKEKRTAPVLHVIYRDGIVYFVLLVVARVILIWLLVARSSIWLGISLQWCLDVVLVSRFYLNLLQVASLPSNVSLWGKQGTSGTGWPGDLDTDLNEFTVGTTGVSSGSSVLEKGKQKEVSPGDTLSNSPQDTLSVPQR